MSLIYEQKQSLGEKCQSLDEWGACWEQTKLTKLTKFNHRLRQQSDFNSWCSALGNSVIQAGYTHHRSLTCDPINKRTQNHWVFFCRNALIVIQAEFVFFFFAYGYSGLGKSYCLINQSTVAIRLVHVCDLLCN